MNAAEIKPVASEIELVRRVTHNLPGIVANYEEVRIVILATLDAIPELEGDVRAKMLSDGITAHVKFGDVVTLGQAEMRMAAILIAMLDAIKREVAG